MEPSGDIAIKRPTLVIRLSGNVTNEVNGFERANSNSNSNATDEPKSIATTTLDVIETIAHNTDLWVLFESGKTSDMFTDLIKRLNIKCQFDDEVLEKIDTLCDKSKRQSDNIQNCTGKSSDSGLAKRDIRVALFCLSSGHYGAWDYYHNEWIQFNQKLQEIEVPQIKIMLGKNNTTKNKPGTPVIVVQENDEDNSGSETESNPNGFYPVKMRNCQNDEQELLIAVMNARLKNGRTTFLFDRIVSNDLAFLNAVRQKFLPEDGKYEQYSALYREMYRDGFEFKMLHSLYHDILLPDTIKSNLLRRMIKKDYFFTSLDAANAEALKKDNLLPQAGRILYCLLGNRYRLLYQESEFKDLKRKNVDKRNGGKRAVADINKTSGWRLCKNTEIEAIWHLFLWAIVANKREMAEHFLFETDCIIGGALLATKMLKSMGQVAKQWKEQEYREELEKNERYFQALAVRIIAKIYQEDRNAAYKNLLAAIPFDLGHQTTPLSIANDAECMDFMGHTSCQTLLNLIWKQYMDLDTLPWKFATVAPFMLPIIRFDRSSLSFLEGNKTDRESTTDTNTRCCDFNKVKDKIKEKVPEKVPEIWFRLKNFYTSPVVKMANSLIFYLVFLGMFSAFVLTQLKPINNVKEVHWLEWIVYIWYLGILFQEIRQIFLYKITSPLYHLDNGDIKIQTWFPYEMLMFWSRWTRIAVILSDFWNRLDYAMLILFFVSVIMRRGLERVDFQFVRFIYSITLILFYLRLLRFGFVSKSFGPRILVIGTLVKDLIKFCVILSIILLSFGIAFQSIIVGTEQSHFWQVADILWRPYWQMFGELFIDDYEMGRNIKARACYHNRTKAMEENTSVCHEWMPNILLAVFMLITNILLLNLLIAIFSASFERIEEESELIWKFHLYGLVNEYYEAPFVPSPINIPYFAYTLGSWLWIKAMTGKSGNQSSKQDNNDLLATWRFTEEDIEDSHNNHFRLHESKRDKDLERQKYLEVKRPALEAKGDTTKTEGPTLTKDDLGTLSRSISALATKLETLEAKLENTNISQLKLNIQRVEPVSVC